MGALMSTMSSEERDPLSPAEMRGGQLRRSFLPSLGFFVVCLIALMFPLVGYTELSQNAQDQVTQYYTWFIHVEIMVFIGIGLLMSFLRRYSLSAIMLNFLGSCLMFLVAILIVGAAHQLLTLSAFIEGVASARQAATGMIAFGAVIGKATPTQLMWMMVALVPAFALNQYLVIHQFHILDVGGSNVIHLFGGYYGLAVSFMLSRRKYAHDMDHYKSRSSYISDVMSTIGTVVLWLYWPSFNGALASVPSAATSSESPGGNHASEQFLCIVNTVISLSGATVSTFMATVLISGRPNPVHIQNATLAGGVAMGAACTLPLTPGGAMVIGLAAGALSTLGYQYLTPALNKHLGLRDTCGIHNLHGLPGILGSFVAGLASLGMTTKDWFDHDCTEVTPRECGGFQLGYQVAGICVAMGISITWGAVVGFVISHFNPLHEHDLTPEECFDDGVWWQDLEVELMLDGSVSHSRQTSHQLHGPHAPANKQGHVELTLGPGEDLAIK